MKHAGPDAGRLSSMTIALDGLDSRPQPAEGSWESHDELGYTHIYINISININIYIHIYIYTYIYIRLKYKRTKLDTCTYVYSHATL